MSSGYVQHVSFQCQAKEENLVVRKVSWPQLELCVRGFLCYFVCSRPPCAGRKKRSIAAFAR